MAKRKLAILSNITVDLIRMKLSSRFDIYIPEGFDTWILECLNPESGIYTGKVDAVVILLDGTAASGWESLEEAEETLNSWKQGILALTGNMTEVLVFISTVDFRLNRIRALEERQYRISLQNEWYQFAQEIAERTDNVYVFDLADVIADMGRKQFYSDKMWYMSSMPYSREGLKAVCNVITNLMGSAFDTRKKIIALDLDNTLWGGVAGEDGPEGIELSNHKEGQRFYDFQRQLLEMNKRGVLLTLVSKNNPEDVEPVLREHPFMLLKEEHFVSPKINWQEKAVNLKELEAELNLTESSFIFVDDNPAEREGVKAGCPQAEVADFPDDTTQLAAFAEKLYVDQLRPLRILKEDLNKTRMYQNEELRKKDAAASLNLEDYLAKLEMRADIHRMRDSEMDRVVQLCGKTNQFNVTTKRYSRNEICEIAARPQNAVYVAYLSDKYGESGLTGVVILLGEGEEIRIDSFLMSCRVMGRKLEDVIMNELIWHYCSDTAVFTAEYIPTSKNLPVKDLYDRLGFSLSHEQNGVKEYRAVLKDYQRREFPFYQEICFESGKL
ncbi:MAG: HAD-IIIC family phosphatase [Lachnospiraceae bacterium]|nr:HAD-IIIC family phosphatase [Lachnospiraceae bacterium]